MAKNHQQIRIEYLSFRKAILSAVKSAATIASGFLRNPNAAIQNANECTYELQNKHCKAKVHIHNSIILPYQE